MMGLTTPKLRLSSIQSVPPPIIVARGQRVDLVGASSKFTLLSGSLNTLRAKRGLFPRLTNRVIVPSSSTDSSVDTSSQLSGEESPGVPSMGVDGVEPLGGKSGCVSFYGASHQSVDEHRIASAPFGLEKGSFLWILAPIALIASLVLPQFLLSPAIGVFLSDQVLAETLTSLLSDASFYAGLATFLLVTNRIQKPYLEFSSKRWGLITGLRGYLTSAWLTMGMKVTLPLFVAYVTWPVLGFPAAVAVAPFLLGCIVQRVFEFVLDGSESSCWPLVPIVFEVYRLYQLTKAGHFIERLMYSMRGLPQSPELFDRTGALISMIVTFQILGLVCLWSLVTFLLRLFPSRPVVQNY